VAARATRSSSVDPRHRDRVALRGTGTRVLKVAFEKRVRRIALLWLDVKDRGFNDYADFRPCSIRRRLQLDRPRRLPGGMADA